MFVNYKARTREGVGGLASPLGVLVCCLAFFSPLPALAQSCWVSGALGMNFGAINAKSATDSQSLLPVTCASNNTPSYVRLCLFIPGGAPIPDLDPRRMTNYNDSFLQYNLYSDATRTQIIGPSGSGFPTYTWTMAVPGNGGYSSASTAIAVYGRVLAGQGGIAPGNYQSQLEGIELRYAFGHGDYPQNCSGGASLNVGSPGVNANVPSGCLITGVSDLDFGTLASPLMGSHDQTASLTLQCPAKTEWSVDLGPGNHYQGIRRMANSAGGLLTYGLYLDPARRQPWGSQSSGGTLSGTGKGTPEVLPIYGRISAQGSVATGDYLDTVVVTVTY